MKLALFTSDSYRHQYLAASLGNEAELKLIVTERKSPKITDTSSYGEEDRAFLKNHFRRRAECEKSYFGKFHFPSETPLLKMPHGGIDPMVLECLEEVDPDYIILFGTSIIPKAFLDRFSGRFINLHLGLSPFYRGSATNLFPYFYREPECVGATIHLASEEVDAGAVLFQLRPEIEPDDDLHEIGNKVILQAGKVLPEIIDKYERGVIEPKVQEAGGKLCKNSQLTPNLLRQIYREFENGLIPTYLKEKETRDSQKPIIT